MSKVIRQLRQVEQAIPGATPPLAEKPGAPQRLTRLAESARKTLSARKIEAHEIISSIRPKAEVVYGPSTSLSYLREQVDNAQTIPEIRSAVEEIRAYKRGVDKKASGRKGFAQAGGLVEGIATDEIKETDA